MMWTDNMLKILLTVLMVLIAGGIGILIAGWLVRALRVKADKEHTIRLSNMGNFRSQYHLSIQSPHPDLTFAFLFNQMPLAPVIETEEDKREEFDDEFIEEVQHSVPVASQQPQAQKAAKPASVNPAGAMKAGQSVAAKSGVFASLLGTLGSILPGKMGAGLKAQAGAARKVQAGTAKAVQAPQAVQRKADALKQSGGRLGVKTEAPKQQTKGGQASSGMTVAESSTNVSTGKVRREARPEHRVAIEKSWKVQTMELGPGEIILLTLQIGTSRRRYPAGSFNYVLQSQQIAVDERFGRATPVSKNGTVYFKPIGLWRYWVPAVSSSLIILFTLIGIFYGISAIWG